jgi:hypothetical protein
MLNYPPVVAFSNLLRRSRIMVGGLDNDPIGSRVPTGDGPDAQGKTRLERAQGINDYTHNFCGNCKPPPSFGLLVAGQTDHDAARNFGIFELMFPALGELDGEKILTRYDLEAEAVC